MKTLFTIVVLVLLACALPVSAAGTLPTSVDVTGNAAGGYGGQLPGGMRYWLGTNLGMPGTADMQWSVRCRTLTLDMQKFGPLASRARVTFYRHGRAVDVRRVDVAPVTLRSSGWFDRVVVTNMTSDPPAVDDSATITLNGATCY